MLTHISFSCHGRAKNTPKPKVQKKCWRPNKLLKIKTKQRDKQTKTIQIERGGNKHVVETSRGKSMKKPEGIKGGRRQIRNTF